MIKKIVLAVVVTALLAGCGNTLKQINPINPNTVLAGFPEQTALTCTGDAQDAGGMTCDESDGHSHYAHYSWRVSTGPDGHGTFQASTEQGTSHAPGLFQITFLFPAEVKILEVHPTLNVKSWCPGNGYESDWNGQTQTGPIMPLLGSKSYIDNSGVSIDYPVPQVVFPSAVPVHTLTLNSFNDLCASSTFNWTLTGSF